MIYHTNNHNEIIISQRKNVIVNATDATEELTNQPLQSA